MKKGLFIVFEGIDGSGKSTQARLLAKKLNAVLTKEPTDSPLGRFVRKLIEMERSSWVQSVFANDRAEHVRKVILPALKKGKTLICDRYILSSMAYAHSRDAKMVKALNAGFPKPDVTFLLDLPAAIALKRKKSLFEKSELERIRRNYLKLKGNAIVIDGKMPANKVARIIFNSAKKV